jgi:hypothetical protein
MLIQQGDQMPRAILEVGPLNGAILLVLLIIGMGAALNSIRRMRAAEDVALWPVVITLALPLLFSLWAGSWQLDAAWADAMVSDPPIKRQTLMAMALSRGVHTQMLAGIVVGVPAFTLIAGCLSVATMGARPRIEIAGTAIALTFALTVTALARGYASGAWGLASTRAVLFLAAGIGTTSALLLTHKRGPGAQVGPLAAVAIPLLIAGLDQLTIGWMTLQDFQAIAIALPADKQALMDTHLATASVLRGFSGLQLALALALASLGPIASLSRRRDLMPRQVGAMVAGLVTAAAVVGFGSTWFASLGM